MNQWVPPSVTKTNFDTNTSSTVFVFVGGGEISEEIKQLAV
jgi:hypothetical protein